VSDPVQDEISTRRCRVPQACELLLEAADPAAGKLAELVNHEDSIVGLRVATALFGRAGHGPSLTQTNVNLDARKVVYEIVGVNTEAL
jgi:hypothetical protein